MHTTQALLKESTKPPAALRANVHARAHAQVYIHMSVCIYLYRLVTQPSIYISPCGIKRNVTNP